ncbi:MAG: tetratricopeptide repeat protein [Sandaracinus sp.]
MHGRSAGARMAPITVTRAATWSLPSCLLASWIALATSGCESDAERARHALALGHDAMSGGRVAEALTQFEHATELDPSSREALVELAGAALQQERPELTIESLDRADRLGASSAAELELRGRAELSLEHWDRAEAALGRAIESDPGRTALHELRGRALAALGRREEAITSYRAAARVDPAMRIRVELARLLLDDEEASGASRPCPAIEPGITHLDREGVPDGADSCLTAPGAPCAPRVEAGELLFAARQSAAEDALPALDALIARTFALETARAEQCWPGGAAAYTASLGPSFRGAPPGGQ